jgi:hypothetical protein
MPSGWRTFHYLPNRADLRKGGSLTRWCIRGENDAPYICTVVCQMGTGESRCKPERPQLLRVCMTEIQVSNGAKQVGMSYARDGNEAANEYSPQGSPHVDYSRHAYFCVGEKNKLPIRQGRPSGVIYVTADRHLLVLFFGAIGPWTSGTCAVHQSKGASDLP